MLTSSGLTYARLGRVEIYDPGPVPAVGKVGHVIAGLEHPAQGTLVLHHGVVGHDLVDVVEVILVAGGQELQVGVDQDRGSVRHPGLEELRPLLPADPVVGQVGRAVRLVEEVQLEPGGDVVLLQDISSGVS